MVELVLDPIETNWLHCAALALRNQKFLQSDFEHT